MDYSSFVQLGLGGVIALIFFVFLKITVRYFIETLTAKDVYIKEITEKFNLTINNHIDHETKALEKLTEVVGAVVKQTKGKRK